LFARSVAPPQLLRFFADFELVAASEQPLPSVPGPFLYGREPDWSDLHQHMDIERRDNRSIKDLVDKRLADKYPPRLVLLADEAGVGKTTTLKRIAHDVATLGQPVLAVRTLSRIDIENAIECISGATASQILLVVDNLADHAEQIAELLQSPKISAQLVIFGAERAYRQEYLDVVLSGMRRFVVRLRPLIADECKQLLERYRRFGLVGDLFATKHPDEFSRRISDVPVAVAICQILNDFRPLDSIVESLWEASDPDDRLPYLCVSLAEYCYSAGLRYSILQAIMGPKRSLTRLLGQVPLRLTESASQAEFVVAVNAVISERILRRTARHDRKVLLTVFARLASALAPHVNRKAIMRRSPEARLAGRLFDSDKITRPFLGDTAEEFYISVQRDWEWNSRYWEQRALLQAESDLSKAIQFARHAVAIEAHPFPLTTLSKLLLKKMEQVQDERVATFGEAFEKLSKAIENEAIRSRISVHPFTTLLAGAARYLEIGGTLTLAQRATLLGYTAEARSRFPGDPQVEAAQRRLDSLMS
jgi:hypothetical protein